MNIFSPNDWYWIVGGNGPHIDTHGAPFTADDSQVYSSARNAFVPATDSAYLEWKATKMGLNGGYDPTTRIDTLDNLSAVLEPLGILVLTPTGALKNLARKLEEAESAGIHYTPSGGQDTVFSTSTEAIAKYTAVWSAIHATPPLASDGDIYVAADGTPVAMSMDDAKAMIAKALAYFRDCANNYAILHAAVLANPTASIADGWPANS